MTDKTSASNSKKEVVQSSAGENILVAYFLVPETSNPTKMTQEEDNSVVVIDGKVLGNTQYVVQIIQEQTGGSLFRIEPIKPYPTGHQALVDLAKKEQNEEVRPEIKAKVADLAQYDTIFVGYPNWWSDMPMILYSFFDEHDFSGKTILPFNTHGGSGFSNTIATIRDLEANATVMTGGFTTSRNDVEQSEKAIIQWLTDLGMLK